MLKTLSIIFSTIADLVLMLGGLVSAGKIMSEGMRKDAEVSEAIAAIDRIASFKEALEERGVTLEEFKQSQAADILAAKQLAKQLRR